MTRALIVYGSAYGQTEKVVRRIARTLAEAGVQCTILKGDALPPGLGLGGFDGFIVAGSVLFGRHQKYLETFVREHHGTLTRLPSMFLSVCGAMSNPTPEAEAMAQHCRLDFLKRTGWAPRLAHSLAGGLAYTRYGFFTRLVMRLISRHNGGPVDTSRDWEFTDWDTVDRLAREFLLVLAGDRPVALTV